jgi:hypothetical protein
MALQTLTRWDTRLVGKGRNLCKVLNWYISHAHDHEWLGPSHD